MSEYGGGGGDVNFDHRVLYHYRIHTIFANCLSASIKKDYNSWIYELYNLFREVIPITDLKEEEIKDYLKKLNDLRVDVELGTLDGDSHQNFVILEVSLRNELQKNNFFLTITQSSGRLL